MLDVRLDRKIQWAANLFIWSAVLVLVVSGFTFFSDWHPFLRVHSRSQRLGDEGHADDDPGTWASPSNRVVHG